VGLEETAPRSTTEAANLLKAGGRDVIELYGSPFWAPSSHVLDAARHAISDMSGAPAEGLLSLRQAIAERLAIEKDIRADPESEILVTNAANHALYVVFTTILDHGDEVLTFSPHYYYQGIIRLAGGEPRYCETFQRDSWRWDVDRLAAMISPRTKAIIVNTPVNPTGYMASRPDLEAVAALARKHHILVIADEAYDHLIYEGADHVSFASLPATKDVCVTISSCTKSYALKYWRVGAIVAPRSLVASLRKVLEWNVFECNHVAQHAARAAFEGPQEWVRAIGSRFERCRDLMIRELAGAPGLSFSVPRGGPFLFINVDEGVLGLRAEGFREVLLQTYGVPTDCGAYFGSTTHLRLAFGGSDEDVSEAGRRVAEAAVTAS
jgi:aspartate/methionine/tyrosine aminotransferase